MAKWILLLVVCLCIGCASQRTKITVTRGFNGEPSISIEFQEKEIKR